MPETPFIYIAGPCVIETEVHTLEIAAQNLGAQPSSALIRIVLPHMAPAILAAFLITFAVSFDEYVISWFTGGLNQTIPVAVLNTLQGQQHCRCTRITIRPSLIQQVRPALTG